MNGILNIDKPAGRTSFSIVAQVRRLSREKRVGHAGTLDPIATGVLPVHLGQATRLVEYLMDTTKTYRAEIELGAVTDTYDSEGRILQTNNSAGITLEQLTDVMAGFRGKIAQIPPVYSALKQQGQPLYQLARSGVTVIPRVREVNIGRIGILKFEPPVVTIEVDCSKGTYIRSLAHDLGQALGCGAYLKNLVRLRCGNFTLEDAVALDALLEAFKKGDWVRFLYPMDTVLSHLPKVVVNRDTAGLITNGTPVQLTGCPENNLCCAYADEDVLLGILKYDPEKDLWHPEKVFR